MSNNEYALTDMEFNALRDYIYKKSGIFFSERNRFQLETKIKIRFDATDCHSTIEYLKLLDDPKKNHNELNDLLNTITVNETSFFRDTFQISAIEKNIIPELIKKNDVLGFKQLRVWSAASSSGEEAYTIAILLAEYLKDSISRWNIKIYATDINDNVLKMCKEGVYNKNSLRNTSQAIIEKYFKKIGSDKYIIRDDIKAMVIPEKCNLIDTSACKRYSGIDILLLRNVLIYFDKESKKKVLKMCYENLKDGGYMMVGHAETIFGLNNNFKVVYFVNVIGYKK